jgi:hypothetical protein
MVSSWKHLGDLSLELSNAFQESLAVEVRGHQDFPADAIREDSEKALSDYAVWCTRVQQRQPPEWPLL